MRTAQLTVIKDGINRLRPKGGARADSLYDLLNGYVTSERTVVVRPGTRRLTPDALPVETVGLVAFESLYYVFAVEDVDLAAYPDFALVILLHPTNPDAQLERIHFAAPFLGALYVVAEFDDAQIFHYWLQEGEPWQAEHEYSANEFVTPTVPNGFVYRAVRFGDPFQAWAPGVPRTEGNGSSIPPSIIEPTTYNEYYYTAIETEGDNPRSAQVEPIWPTATGAQIVETADETTPAENVSVNPPTPPTPNQPQSSTTDRYEL